MIAQALVFRAIASFIPGFGQAQAGLQFAGLFAHGGRIGSGEFGMVGEAGRPEVVSSPSFVRGPAQVEPMAGGGNASAVASEILSRVGPPPGNAPPQAIARDSWWRETFALLATDNSEREG